MKAHLLNHIESLTSILNVIDSDATPVIIRKEVERHLEHVQDKLEQLQSPENLINQVLVKFANNEISKEQAVTILNQPEFAKTLIQRELDRHTAYTDKK